MAIEANHEFSLSRAQEGSSFTPYDRAPSFRRAERHTRIVKILRIAFPVTAVLLLGLYYVTSSISVSIGDLQASVKRIEINRDRLRMVDPKMEGVTKDKGAYTLTADYAEQEIKNPSLVHLTAVRADMNSAKKGWTRMTAPTGLFDTTKEILVLTGDIRIATSSGMTSRLTRAGINMKTQRIVSDQPVVVKALNGTINSKTMEILMSEKIVIFRGDIRVHIYKRPVKNKDAKSAQ